MGHYHALATPITKEAGLPLKAIGRSLMSRGLWGTAAKGGERLAAGGGSLAGLGRGIATGAGAMRTASPYLAGYGLTGMVGEPFGVDLPGSHLAFNVGAPMWGAMATIPGAIRSGRLATGKYDGAIEQDARAGARQAGQRWMTATQEDGRTAYDPNAYVDFLRQNGIDTESAGRYFGNDPIRRPGTWSRIGNVFENPTGNVVPEVRERIYNQMFKGAAFTDLEKSAFWGAAARLAGKAAWGTARGQGKNVVSAGWGAAKANMGATRAGQFLARHPNVGKWGGRALTGAFVGASVLDGADATFSDKPYDEAAIQQEGYDGAQAAIRRRMSQMTPFERQMARFDPSLAVNGMEDQLPGTIAAWEQANGRPYQPGFLGGLQQAWNGRGTPQYYGYDAGGTEHYL